MVGVLAPRQEARLADEMNDIGPADEETRSELASSNERREDPLVESSPRLVQFDERALAAYDRKRQRRVDATADKLESVRKVSGNTNAAPSGSGEVKRT
jgi:hypothetical protein